MVQSVDTIGDLAQIRSYEKYFFTVSFLNVLFTPLIKLVRVLDSITHNITKRYIGIAVAGTT